MSHPQLQGVKVGYTNNVAHRLSMANIHCPLNQFSMEHVSYFADPKAAEARLHGLLAETRITGEWFDIHHKQLLMLLALVEEELGGIRKFNEV